MEKKAEQLLSQFLQNKDNLWSFVYSIVRDYHLSEDVLQEVCFTIMNNAEKFDLERPFLPWAFGIAKNKSYEAIRKSEKQATLLDDNILEKLQNDLISISRQENIRLSALQMCLKEVSNENRSILMMKYVEKLSAQNISERIKRTETATFSLLQRLRNTLANCIGKKINLGTMND